MWPLPLHRQTPPQCKYYQHGNLILKCFHLGDKPGSRIFCWAQMTWSVPCSGQPFLLVWARGRSTTHFLLRRGTTGGRRRRSSPPKSESNHLFKENSQLWIILHDMNLSTGRWKPKIRLLTPSKQRRRWAVSWSSFKLAPISGRALCHSLTRYIMLFEITFIINCLSQWIRHLI